MGDRLTESDSLGHATTYAYNLRKQATTITDANNNATTNVYDNNGNLLGTTDALESISLQGPITPSTDPRRRLRRATAKREQSASPCDRAGYCRDAPVKD